MSRKADSVSVLATRHPCPRLWMPLIALSIVMYWRLWSSFEMKWLILVAPDFGNDKWKMVLNLLESFLGTKPMGETWKLVKRGGGGGGYKRARRRGGRGCGGGGGGGGGGGWGGGGAVIRASNARLEVTISGWANAVGRFLQNLGTRGPV